MCGYIGDYDCLSENESFQVIKEGKYLYLGTSSGCGIDIVPMYYVTVCQNDIVTIYLIDVWHGQGLENMKACNEATILVTQIIDNVNKSKFLSVMGKGCISFETNCIKNKLIYDLFNQKYKSSYNTMDSFQTKDKNYIRIDLCEITGRTFYRE